MNAVEDRLIELVLQKLDTVIADQKEFRAECHSLFARQSDFSAVHAHAARLEVRLETLEKQAERTAGAKAVEIGIAKWALGILGAVLATIGTAWLMSR